jgi:predicted unusual protein kinase regulating ubiquinone biosynthesis (AarF/ABC1/UbiB family)
MHSISDLPPITQAKTPEQRARNIRAYLQQLGSWYPYFALYLSSRIDLLPATYCQEFALVPDSAAPLSAVAVKQLLVDEYGSDVGSVFLEFDSVPLKSGLIVQTHMAKLSSGAPAVVVLLRPEYYEFQTGHGIPRSFDGRLLRNLFAEIAAEDAATDFFDTLRRRTDFTLQAEALQLMANDTASSDLLAAPSINRKLCTSKALLFNQVEGKNIGQFLQLYPYHRDIFAVRLCQLWFHQALFGQCYPVDHQKDGIMIGNDSRLFFGDCDLARIPKTAKTRLWNYLIATATDDPDKAAMHLLPEMSHPGNSRIDPEGFRSSFRQAASFGALAPVLGTNSNSLSQLVFQHWKTAMEHGYRPQPHLLSFYRGLFCTARIARTLSPARDPLREGLEELRSARTLQQVGKLGDLGYWVDNIDKFAAAFVCLPKAVDEALNQGSRAAQEHMVLTRPQQSLERNRSRFLGSVMAIFILAATVFLSRFPGMDRWTAKLAAIALMLAGWLLLRQAED